MFQHRVSITPQRTGSDPWACVLLRLSQDSGRDRCLVLQASQSHRGVKGWLRRGGIYGVFKGKEESEGEEGDERMLQEVGVCVKRDRDLHEPDESHRYLGKAGEKRAEVGCWLEELPRGGSRKGLLGHAKLFRFYTEIHKTLRRLFSPTSTGPGR